MKYQSILIISYGRSGSTLLREVINTIDNVHLKGENYSFCFGLYQTWKSLTSTKKKVREAPDRTAAWYGSDGLDPELFIKQAQKIVFDQLVGEKNLGICFGFKEVRYIYILDVLEEYLHFLSRIFPKVAFVFNKRCHDDVTKSGWWKNRDPIKLKEKLTSADLKFAEYCRKHENAFLINYEDVIKGDKGLLPLFEFLGADLFSDRINKVLKTPHSFNCKPTTIDKVGSGLFPQELVIDPLHKDRVLKPGHLVVSVVKDEFLRLPWFLSYYRKMGFTGFIFVDNDSTDGTIAYLKEQEDIILYHAPANMYAKSQYGAEWANAVSIKHAMGRWVLRADADELLSWPKCEREGINGLIFTAESLGEKSAFTPLLDVYSDADTITGRKYIPGEPFSNYYCWIDPISNYRMVLIDNTGKFLLRGGPRNRGGKGNSGPLMTKEALYLVENYGAKLEGCHFLTTKASSVLVAPLLHYKFMSDFDDKIDKAIREGEHYLGGKEYVEYKEKGLSRQNLKLADSVRVQSGDDLVTHVDKISTAIKNYNQASRTADHRPFIIWTLRRTGGTALSSALFSTSSYDTIEHEPFNSDRLYGHLVESWKEERNNERLDQAIENILANKVLIKHCFEMVPKAINDALMETSIRNGYRHVFLLRKNPKDRLLSLNYSLMTGVWGDRQSKTKTIDPSVFKRPIPVDQRLKHEISCRKEAHRIYSKLRAMGCDPELIYFEDLFGNDYDKSIRIVERVSSSLCLPNNLSKNKEFCKKLFDRYLGTRNEYTKFPEIEIFLDKVSTLPDFDIASIEYDS